MQAPPAALTSRISGAMRQVPTSIPRTARRDYRGRLSSRDDNPDRR
jgi:hypothetical protein